MASEGLKEQFLRRFSAVGILSWSFEQATVKAAETDKLLVSVEDDLLAAITARTPTSLRVPSLSVNPTQARFDFNGGGKMNLLFRDVTRQLWTALLALMENNNVDGIYINGPQGIGKSHAMYGCACILRVFRQRVRLTYIQSCEEWVKSHGKDPFRFLLNELCSTFQSDAISDEEGKKTIVEWADWVNESKADERDSRFKDLMIVLNDFVSKEKLCWITLVDQENALHSDNHPFEGKHATWSYPFNIIRSFSSKVIVSASANNEAFRSLPSKWTYFDFTSLSLDANETTTFTSYTDEEFDFAIPRNYKGDASLDDLTYWTNKVPLEITELLRKSGESLKEKIAVYLEARSAEFRRRHRQFLKDSKTEELESFRRALACTSLSLPLDDDTCLDRQLMFMRDKYVFTLTPLALKMMRDLSPDGNKQAMDVAIDQVLSNDSFTNDVKGRVLEKYVIESLERIKLWEGSASSFGPKGGKRSPLAMHVNISRVLHFAGMKTPTADDINFEQSVMFVPLNSYYPAVDLLIWDAKLKTLFAIQVTIREKVSDHMNETLDGDTWTPLRDAWKKFCGAETVNLIWVSDNDERGRYNGEWLMLLEDMVEAFPLLAKFKRCPRESIGVNLPMDRQNTHFSV